MSLRVVSLGSLTEELDLLIPARDCSPMPVALPRREAIEFQLSGNPRGKGSHHCRSCGRLKKNLVDDVCAECRRSAR